MIKIKIKKNRETRSGVAFITHRVLPSMEAKLRFLRRLMQNDKYRNLYKQQLYEKQLNVQRMIKPRLG